MRNHVVPRVTTETAGFWEGTAAGELRAQQCGACSSLRFPPQPMCPACRSMERSWVPVAGRGTVYTFSVVTGEGPERALPGTHGLPYGVAVIELECGVRMVTDIDTEHLADLRVGSAVEVTFERINDQITLPRFLPALSPLAPLTTERMHSS